MTDSKSKTDSKSRIANFFKSLFFREIKLTEDIKEEIKDLVAHWAEIREKSDEIERQARGGKLKSSTLGGANLIDGLQDDLDQMKETIGKIWEDDEEIQEHLKNALTTYKVDFNVMTEPGKEMKKEVELTEDMKKEIKELIADWAKIRQMSDEIERQAKLGRLDNWDSMEEPNIIERLQHRLDQMKETLGKVWKDDKKIQEHLRNALNI